MITRVTAAGGRMETGRGVAFVEMIQQSNRGLGEAMYDGNERRKRLRRRWRWRKAAERRRAMMRGGDESDEEGGDDEGNGWLNNYVPPVENVRGVAQTAKQRNNKPLA